MKKTFIIGVSVLFGFVMAMGVSAASEPAKTVFITIGTGDPSGVYYPSGNAIARIVNKKKMGRGIRVTIESTGGSVFNVNAIASGDLEFGIVQSDRQYQAWNGIKDWEVVGPQEKLRAVCSLYPESVVLIAGDDTGIEQFADLKGKHVSIGNPGSGQRGNAADALTACGIDYEKDMKVEGFTAAEAVKTFLDGRIDAFFYTVGHPNASIKEATSGRRKAHFVPIFGACVDTLLSAWPYTARAHIPIKFYPMARNTEDVNTFAVKATFCTSADVPDDVVYTVTREIFENLEEFKKLHPAFGDLTRKNMLEALSAPIHPGAMKYYTEAGLK
ncbi:MAG: TAXI family TRAP transporter solute-binding subunit [Pseudomonadota bacterium]